MSRILVTLPDALLEDVDEIVATSDYKRSGILVEGVRLFKEDFNRKKLQREIGEQLLQLLSDYGGDDVLSKHQMAEIIKLTNILVKQEKLEWN